MASFFRLKKTNLSLLCEHGYNVCITDAESKLRALKPFRCAAYKDSIASRLRLEARSKSKSPSKIPIRPGAYRTSSGRSTPRARSMSRDERVIDYLDILAPPRTLSETSYITKDKDRLRCSTNELGLVDSRSKTLNAVYHYNGNAQDLAHRRPPYKLSANASKSNSLNLNSLNNETGYGSPLVLPMHKRLTLRREGSKLGSNVISLSNTIGHIKSPNLLKPRAENRLPSPTLFNRFRALQGTNIFAPEVTISVITHLVFWRIVTIVSGSWPFSWVFVTSVIAVSVLFWTASQSPEAVNRRPWNYSTSMKHDTSKEFVGSVGRCSSNRDKRPPSSPVRSRYHSPTRKSNSFDKNPHLASNEVKNRALYTRVKSANASFDCQRLKISVNLSEDKEGSSLSINQNKKEATNQRNPLHKNDFTLATRQPLKKENSGLKAIKKESSVTSKKESVSSTKRMEHLKSDKPSGIRPPQIRSKLGNRNEPRSNSSSDNSPERSTSKTKTDTQRNPSTGDIPKAKQTLREAVNDSIKKNNAFKPPASKDISPIPVIGKPGSAVRSNKSFKPQLEDIKSSILLLNKKNFQPDPAIPKPKPVDENERKKKLEEAKEKFRSKHFRNEAKYDKIEGLNWISWK